MSFLILYLVDPSPTPVSLVFKMVGLTVILRLRVYEVCALQFPFYNPELFRVCPDHVQSSSIENIMANSAFEQSMVVK